MNNLDIYTINLTGYPEAQYVLYRDYERLKYEVESQNTNPAYRLLRASQEANARLRKAGDAMAVIIRPPAHGPGEHDSAWLDWNAAKDGNLTA